MVKRLYHLLALLALVHLFALGGLMGYLVASGKLTPERAEQIAGVLRGEVSASSAATSQPAAAAPEPSQREITRAQAEKEAFELAAERHRREMEDRLALNQTIQLQTMRLLEEIDRKEKTFEEQRAEALAESNQIGFAQALELYSSIDPKKAKDLLMKHEKEADAVQLLMQMDNSKRKKIINACKGDVELEWAGRILAEIRELNEDTATGVDGSSASSLSGG